jgi:hypothetical protein
MPSLKIPEHVGNESYDDIEDDNEPELCCFCNDQPAIASRELDFGQQFGVCWFCAGHILAPLLGQAAATVGPDASTKMSALAQVLRRAAVTFEARVHREGDLDVSAVKSWVDSLPS